jgi:hypothetical protein
MNFLSASGVRHAALLAINLLYLMVWGFPGIGKLLNGPPSWFPEKFGGTILASFPGLTATFWLLALAETATFVLAAVSLVRLEFLAARPPRWLPAMLVCSLFVFFFLGFGQWLTSDFTATFQLFMYFCGTVVVLQFVGSNAFHESDAN